jgi:tetrahydromethanopterin S-methyltransferase subunit F
MYTSLNFYAGMIEGIIIGLVIALVMIVVVQGRK